MHECISSAHMNQGLNHECLVHQIFTMFIKLCQCAHTVKCYGCRKLIDILYSGKYLGGKSWRKCKIRHIGGFKFDGFTIIHQPHPSFKLLTRVRMEGEADVAKFVLESRKAINFLKVTKQRHLHTILDETRA